MCLMAVPGGVESVRKIPEEIVAEPFPNSMEILHVQEAHFQITLTQKPHLNTIVKLLKPKTKRKP